MNLPLRLRARATRIFMMEWRTLELLQLKMSVQRPEL
jgi:hypothetical protein